MRKFIVSALILLMCLILLPVPGHCGRIRWGGTDRTTQLSRQLPFDLIYRGANRGGVSTIVSTVTPLTTANISFGLIYIANGSPGRHPLPDGEIGQEITIQLLANPVYTIIDDTVGDMLNTGWDSIDLMGVNSWVTLTWLDDTYGWIITGASPVGVTINY